MSVNDPDAAPPPGTWPSATLAGDSDSVPGGCVAGVVGGVDGGREGDVEAGVGGGREPCGRVVPGGTAGSDPDAAGVMPGVVLGVTPGVAAASDPGTAGVGVRCPRA